MSNFPILIYNLKKKNALLVIVNSAQITFVLHATHPTFFLLITYAIVIQHLDLILLLIVMLQLFAKVFSYIALIIFFFCFLFEFRNK